MKQNMIEKGKLDTLYGVRKTMENAEKQIKAFYKNLNKMS